MTHPLAEILARHPTLTAVGFESISSADSTQAEAIAGRRRELLESYVLKQIAEREMGYLSNGVFIAAMLHCGHRFLHPGKGNPNAYFPLHKRKVKALDQRRDRIRQQQASGI